jgi:hypothetical protein
MILLGRLSQPLITRPGRIVRVELSADGMSGGAR